MSAQIRNRQLEEELRRKRAYVEKGGENAERPSTVAGGMWEEGGAGVKIEDQTGAGA